MKKLLFLTSLLFCMVLLTFSCQDQSKEDVRNQAVESVQTTPAAPANGATTNSGVKHYTCPNNCAGSGGDTEGTCPVCGTAYVHNAAFHDNAGTPSITPSAGEQPTVEPAQNAAGVWHYTCPKGCEGGAGGAGSCAKCGSALAHNQDYHK